MSAATEMFTKAVDLCRASALLHCAHHEHAALICAIHSGINGADAIGLYEDDPYRGTEHRAAADHLRQLDTRFRKPAQSLRRRIDRKSTAEYRRARYTRNQVSDAIGDARLLLEEAALWLDVPIADVQTTVTISFDDIESDGA